jgi:peptidyl-prolyl cis-trans isomerase SurA
MRRLAAACATLLLSGCATPSLPTMPSWVPLVGKKAPPPPPPPATPATTPTPPSLSEERLARAREADQDQSIADRVVAVVNNDAITLAELQEQVVAYQHENRQTIEATEELLKQFLGRLIDTRLQLQEADREKIVIDDIELAEELAERYKKFGARTLEEFEAMVKAQGITMETVRKRLRDSLKVSKVVRRKVALRVSVTDPEIDAYLAKNRGKLETGLPYHARHILVVPQSDSDAAWEAARIRAEMIVKTLSEGGDFAALARQWSRDASARDGGDLGLLKRGELSPEIEAQILGLDEGEVSQPYRSGLGWHIFRLESKETLEGEGLQRARQQIREILFREKYEARLDAWLREIKQRAIIEVRM